uniref:Transcription initiation factor TFIID subunit 12b-like isoform X2 n=1 Tax=Rhizophora mucronata TaxID=61149 RepID=A0A2P2KQG6_RHIMU
MHESYRGASCRDHLIKVFFGAFVLQTNILVLSDASFSLSVATNPWILKLKISDAWPNCKQMLSQNQ